MDRQLLGRLDRVAVFLKQRLERLDQHRRMLAVAVEQIAERFLHEAVDQRRIGNRGEQLQHAELAVVAQALPRAHALGDAERLPRLGEPAAVMARGADRRRNPDEQRERPGLPVQRVAQRAERELLLPEARIVARQQQHEQLALLDDGQCAFLVAQPVVEAALNRLPCILQQRLRRGRIAPFEERGHAREPQRDDAARPIERELQIARAMGGDVDARVVARQQLVHDVALRAQRVLVPRERGADQLRDDHHLQQIRLLDQHDLELLGERDDRIGDAADERLARQDHHPGDAALRALANQLQQVRLVARMIDPGDEHELAAHHPIGDAFVLRDVVPAHRPLHAALARAQLELFETGQLQDLADGQTHRFTLPGPTARAPRGPRSARTRCSRTTTRRCRRAARSTAMRTRAPRRSHMRRARRY